MKESLGQKILKATRLLSVEPYLFFVLFAYSIRIASFQDLLIDRACLNMLGYSKNICSNLDQHEAVKNVCLETGNNLYMSVTLMSSLPAIVVAIFLGPWSDRYTRKWPLLIAASGQLLENAAAALITFLPGVSPVWYTVVALFSGLSGGFIISVSAACSYLSDITDERSRPSRFAVLEFFNIAAIIFGSVFGGLVYAKWGYKTVMLIPAVGYGLSLLYAALFVTETKPPVEEGRRGDMFRDLLKVDNIKQSYITCSRKRAGNIRLQIWLLVWIGACVRFSDMGFVAVGYAYAKKMYKWSVPQYSDASVAYYTVNALVTVGVVPFLSNGLRLHEAAIGLCGIFSIGAKMLLTGVSNTGPFFYFAWLSGSLGNAAGIAVRSRLSKLVNKEELGRAFSLLGTCESVTPLLGTVFFLQIYNVSYNFYPGLTFILAGIFLLPCALIFAWMMRMPTISLSEYAREEDMKKAQPLEDISSHYQKLKEDTS